MRESAMFKVDDRATLMRVAVMDACLTTGEALKSVTGYDDEATLTEFDKVQAARVETASDWNAAAAQAGVIVSPALAALIAIGYLLQWNEGGSDWVVLLAVQLAPIDATADPDGERIVRRSLRVLGGLAEIGEGDDPEDVSETVEALRDLAEVLEQL